VESGFAGNGKAFIPRRAPVKKATFDCQ